MPCFTVRMKFISIHALRGEGDLKIRKDFISCLCISIHALRGEGDLSSEEIYKLVMYFNPRPPWGGRLGNSLFGFSCC